MDILKGIMDLEDHGQAGPAGQFSGIEDSGTQRGGRSASVMAYGGSAE